jgi:serine protease Do
MAIVLLSYPIHLARILSVLSLFAGSPEKAQITEAVSTLLRVNIVVETRGARDTVELNGKLLREYSPIIIQDFSSTGIVLDNKGHVMTFLGGYHWVDIQGHDPRIEVSTSEGQKWKGKLVGIDQSNGVAVLRLLTGRPKKTPVCTQCEVKDGVTIASPAIEGPSQSQFREAQIHSVGANREIPEQEGWIMAMNRPFAGIGLPILTTDHRVLGFIAGQDPRDMSAAILSIDKMISSAEKILKAGGDIHAGWLGVFLLDLRSATSPGVVVQQVEPDSPAQRAGLAAQDFLLNYNGLKIRDARQLIQLVEGTPLGSTANLEILRQGNPMTVTALIEARRPRQNPGRLSLSFPSAVSPNLAGIVSEPALRSPKLMFGLDTLMLTPALAEALQMPRQTGLLVTDVAKGLPADLAGILVGDVIMAIDGQPIADAFSFASFLETHAWSAQPVLKILRKGVERTIPVQIPDQGK